jgi:putative ABC transport system permease protein
LYLYLSIVRMAFRNLWANKLRSALTMLGIVIGVASVSAMLSIGDGARDSIITDVREWGTNRLSLRPGQRTRGAVQTDTVQSFTLLDAQEILKRVETVDSIAPEVRGIAQAKRGNRNARASLTGSSNTYFEIFNFQIDQGRSFLESEERLLRRVAVLGPKMVEKLFGSAKAQAVGEQIRLNGELYLVVGVTKPKGDQGWFNPDDQIFLPYSTMMKRVIGSPNLQVIHLHVEDEEKVYEAQDEVREKMRVARRIPPGRPDDFIINNSEEFLENVEKFTLVFKLLLAGIAAISLFVAGIGIMNIMLVTVAERTREIGIRKALGAKNHSILTQFLIETLVICLVGGAMGLLVGGSIVYIFNYATSGIEDMFTAKFSEAGLALGLGVSAGVGLTFGVFPAVKASRLDPIEALRSE